MALAALNYSISKMYKIDLFSYITNRGMISSVFYTIIALSALIHLFNRDYYLSFLGPTVMPVKEKQMWGKLIDVTLDNLPPNTRIIYWAANESQNIFSNPIDAYSGYANSGFTKSNDKGQAVIQINCPSEYIVSKFGFKKRLDKHVHYRIESDKFPGLFSSVKTQYINC